MIYIDGKGSSGFTFSKRKFIQGVLCMSESKILKDNF